MGMGGNGREEREGERVGGKERERVGGKEKERVGGREEECGGIPRRRRMGVWGWGVLWWRGAEGRRGPLPELSTSPGQKEGQDPGIWSQKEDLFKKLELNGPNSANLEPK